MVGGVVVPDGRVVPSCRQIEVIIVGVLKEQTLWFCFESVTGVFCLKDEFTEKFEVIRNVGGDEQVQFAQVKRSGIPMTVGTEEIDIAKTTNAEQGLTKVHALVFGMLRGFSLTLFRRVGLLGAGTRGGCRLFVRRCGVERTGFGRDRAGV